MIALEQIFPQSIYPSHEQDDLLLDALVVQHPMNIKRSLTYLNLVFISASRISPVTIDIQHQIYAAFFLKHYYAHSVPLTACEDHSFHLSFSVLYVSTDRQLGVALLPLHMRRRA